MSVPAYRDQANGPRIFHHSNADYFRSVKEIAREDGDEKKGTDENELESNGAAAAVTNDSQLSLEADNIVQDALQLAENDELNEYRDVSVLMSCMIA